MNVFKQRIIKTIQMLYFCKRVQKHEYNNNLKRVFNIFLVFRTVFLWERIVGKVPELWPVLRGPVYATL